MGTANVLSSGWEDTTGTAATCVADAADPLTDNFRWNGDYGPGSGAVCSATPPIAALSTTVVHSGTKSLQVHFKNGDGSNGPDFRISRIFGTEYPYLWISWYQYWDANWYWADHDHKLVILGQNSPSFSQDVYFNVRGNGDGTGRLVAFVASDDTVFSDLSAAGTVLVGAWNRIEARIVSGTHGRVEVRLNGVALALTKEAGAGSSNPLDTNTGPSLGYIKLDTTYNDFATFESHVVGGASNTYYDDVGVGDNGWIDGIAGGGGGGSPVVAGAVTISHPVIAGSGTITAPSVPGVMRQIVSVVAATVPLNGFVSYAPIVTAGQFVTTEATSTHPWSAAGTLTNLVVRARIAPGTGKNFVFALRINGSTTALTCTLADTATTARDTTHSVAVAAGDRVSIIATPSGTPALGGFLTFSLEFASTAPGESSYGRHVSTVVAGGAGTRYAPPFSGGPWAATAAAATVPIPLAGTLTRLDAYANGALGSGRSNAITWYLNGVKQDGTAGTPNTTATITAGNTTASSTFSLPVVPGDLVYLECIKVGTGFETIGYGLGFAATTNGLSIVSAGSGATASASGTRYTPPGWSDGSTGLEWSTTEANMVADGAVNLLTLSALYVVLDGTPGTGKSYTVSLRLNGASPAGTVSVTIADSATSGSDLSGAVTVLDGDIFDMRSVPAGTPTARAVRWTMVQGIGVAPASGGIIIGPPGLGGTGTVSSEVAIPGAVVPIISLLLNGVWTDVTSDVLSREPIVAFSGRRTASPTAVIPEPGQLTFTLNNSNMNSAHLAAYYSPYHTACRAGFGLRTPARMTLSSPAEPSGHVIWVGRIVSLSVNPGERGERGVRVTATDLIGNLGESACPGLPVAFNQTAGQLVTSVLTALADPDVFTGLYALDIDPTVTAPVFPVAFDSTPDGATALEELNRIVMSERGRLYTRLNGILTFRSRDMIDTPAVTARLRDTMTDLQLRSTSEDLAQRVEIRVYPTSFFANNLAPLYSLSSGDLLLHSGETNTALFGPFRDVAAVNNLGSLIGGMDFILPVVATTDYTMNSLADGSGTDLTAHLIVVPTLTAKGVSWSLTNDGTVPGYVTKLQVRGRPIWRTPTTIVQTIATSYGSRVLTFEMPYETDLTVVQSVALNETAWFARPGQARAAALTFPASRTPALASYLFLEQGSRVAVTEQQTGLSLTEYLIVGQKWELQAPSTCLLTWYLEAIEMTGWITPAFSAGTYLSSNGSGVATGSWTVTSGDVGTYKYMVSNRTMTVCIELDFTTVAGGPTYLVINLPDSRVSNLFVRTPIIAFNNGTRVDAYACVNEGGTAILIGLSDGGTWAASTNNTSIMGEIFFETTV